MEIEQLENTTEEEHGCNDIDSSEETKNCERNESFFGLTRGKICESCEIFEKFTPLGQSVRRCQACARRKNTLGKKPFHEESGREEILEMDSDDNDEPPVVATSRFVTNTKSKENWNDSVQDSCNESFAVEHEHVDLLNANVAKVPNLTNNEDGKVGLRKKESVFLNKKEYKPLNVSEPTSKKEKFGYSKGRSLLEKDITMPSERREQTVEILDAQKTKEEIELERRERGWIVNSSVAGKSASHSKVLPMKNNVATTDGYSPGKEQKERIKVKNLKEKPDTQRILGIVAKRSESRINSPTHRAPIPNYKRNEETEVSYPINMKNHAPPSITLHEKFLEPSKSQDTPCAITVTLNNNESNSNWDDNKRQSLCTNIEEEEEELKLHSHVPQEDSKQKCSSPTNLGNCGNETILFGTQRILELLAKRNRSRVSSPKPSLEINARDSETKNTCHGEPIESKKTKISDVIFHSSKLHDQQPEDSSTSPLIILNANNKHDSAHKSINEKMSNLNHGIDPSRQMYNIQQELEHNNRSPTDVSYHFHDNKFCNTHQVLELIAQKNENNTTSPKECIYYNIKDDSSSNIREHGFLKPNVAKVTNEVTPSYSKENQEITSPKTSPKATHSTSTLCNHNIIYKENKGIVETIMHSNVDSKTSKTKYEEVLLRPNLSGLKFSTPSSTICHVNNDPLYGTKFESEPTNCTSTSTNESHSHTSNPFISLLVAHDTFAKPLKDTSNQALETNCKETCSTSLSKNPSIQNSFELTPLYKSAMTTPMCKSPDPNKEVNRRNFFQIEPKVHVKEVEIVEEKDFLILKNKRIKELDNSNFEKNIKRCDPKNSNSLELLHAINLIGSTENALIKNSSKEKEIKCKDNPKASFCKKTSKCQSILWPMKILFGVLMYPFKLLLRSIFFLLYIFKSIFFGIFKALKKLKNITTIGIGNIRLKFLKKFQSGCTKGQGYSRCGCASKTYILVVLGSLLLPSLFDLDFYLVNKFIEGQIVIRETLNFDYTKEHPIAMVNLLPPQILGKAKGYFPDKEVMTTHVFPPSYVFHTIVHLTLPESQYNHETGMFQVVIETFSTRGHSLNKASRASMLRYHSPLVKYMKSVIMGIPIVLGLYHESQTLSIQMIESQEENEHSPTASICVEIEPKAGHVTGGGVPEMYHAQLQVIAHNPYLREVARNWVWNLYICSGVGLFIFEVLLVLCCCQKVLPQKVGGKKRSEETLIKNKKMMLERGQKVVQLPKRLHRSHVCYPKNLPLALPYISTVNCGDTSLEEFKVIRVTDNSIPKTSCKLSF